jgi:hypothetical protein
MISPRERRPAGASDDWVSRLPELIEAVCEDWRLSLDDESMAGGAWGIVLCCHTASGREAVLRLCANQGRLNAETSAMLAWAGGPAVDVLAYRPGALLFERARPGTPSRLAPSLAGWLCCWTRFTSQASRASETGARASPPPSVRCAPCRR